MYKTQWNLLRTVKIGSYSYDPKLSSITTVAKQSCQVHSKAVIFNQKAVMNNEYTPKQQTIN